MKQPTFRLLKSDGTVSVEVYTVGQSTRRGTVALISGDKVTKGHPTRLLPVDGDSQVVADYDGKLQAKCPKCDSLACIDMKSVKTATCPSHGSFTLSWSGVPAVRVPTRAGKPKKAAATATVNPINFGLITKHKAQLYTKTGLAFDHPEYELRSHTVISGSRAYSFNSYNNLWGKKSHDDDLACFLAGKPNKAGKKIGSDVADVDALVARLKKKGYQKVGRTKAAV